MSNNNKSNNKKQKLETERLEFLKAISSTYISILVKKSTMKINEDKPIDEQF